jgi:predicted enzyme related to lactoylglutathione lyase
MGNPVVQFQILSRNPERTAEFYSALFDWTVSADNPLGYRQIHTGAGRGIGGGIWPAPPQAPSFVQLFVEVADAAAAVAKATELGAHVIMPAQQLPDGETLAILQDTEGMTFGVYAPAVTSTRA